MTIRQTIMRLTEMLEQFGDIECVMLNQEGEFLKFDYDARFEIVVMFAEEEGQEDILVSAMVEGDFHGDFHFENKPDLKIVK